MWPSLVRRTAGSTSKTVAPLSVDQAGVYPITYVPPLKTTRTTFKRADRGLYDGKTVSTRNNVPEFGHKTRRTVAPNVRPLKLYSEALDQSIPLKATVSAMRKIDLCGGLDRYVLTTKDARLGGFGMRIRDLVVAAIRERASLSAGFTRPIDPSEAWRIPRYESPGERTKGIVREMRRQRAFEKRNPGEAYVSTTEPGPSMVQSRHATEVEVKLVRKGEEPVVDQSAGRARAGPRSTHPRRRLQ